MRRVLLSRVLIPDPNVAGATGTEQLGSTRIPNKQNWSEWNVRGDYDFSKHDRAPSAGHRIPGQPGAESRNLSGADSIFPVAAPLEPALEERHG